MEDYWLVGSSPLEKGDKGGLFSAYQLTIFYYIDNMFKEFLAKYL
jgi:hypothetical protein